MGSVFEVFNDNGKLSVTDETPCVYVIAKRKIGSYDDISAIATVTYKDYQLTYRNLGGRVYYVGFDLNQLPDGNICIDTRVSSGVGTSSSTNIYIYGEPESVSNVDLYFFGVKKKTEEGLAGMELYDKDGYVLFTSRSGTQYPKVLRASTEDSVSFPIPSNPAVLVVVGWDVIDEGSWGSRRHLPWITKNGTSITVNKQYAGEWWPSTHRSEYLYNWFLLSLQRVE